MSEEDGKFDGIFLNVAQQAGNVENILDSFFGFLQRKTDFFTGAEDEKKPEELVLKYFKKHFKAGQKRKLEEQEKHRIADVERKKRAEEQKKKDEEEYNKKQKAQKDKKVQDEVKIEEIDEEEEKKIREEKKNREKAEVKPDEEKKEEKKEEVPEVDKEEEDDKEPPPVGNGGSTDLYTWTQTLSTVEVFIPVKPGVKAKQIVCDMGVDTIKVGLKGEPLIINGKWHAKVKPDDCTWTLIDNKAVQVSLEKHDGMKWWSCVVQGDAEINTKKIVPENSKLGDLDGETRMTVEKMMYDQRQKALGKPTSDQEKTHALLEKFKMAHPEMDFSNAKINYGGGGGGMNFGQ